MGGPFMGRRVLVLSSIVAAALAALPLLAQEGHPLSGTWHGEWHPAPGQKTSIVAYMKWDNKAIIGAINPGPRSMPRSPLMPLCGPSVLKRMARIRLETSFMCRPRARWKTLARIIVRFRAHGPRAASKAISKSDGIRFCALRLSPESHIHWSLIEKDTK